MAGKIGMMNEAYFTGKAVLIDWINNFLEVRIEKVEQMASGSLYCNLFDALHPGLIPMKRVDFGVKYDYEFVNNWKHLQTAFKRVGIDKPIPVEKLIKAKYQDNLEFFQWMYKYAHDVYNGDPDNPDYDAIGRRALSKNGKKFTGSTNKGGSSRAGGGGGAASKRRPNRATSNVRSTYGGSRSSIRGTNRGSSSNNQASAEIASLKQDLRESREKESAYQDKCKQLSDEIAQLTGVAKEIETERDFYFNKVLEIENICKAHESEENGGKPSGLIEQIFAVLYKTSEDENGAANGSRVDGDGTDKPIES